MNVLGLVFAILTILSFTTILSFSKQNQSRRTRSIYFGHLAANRHILEESTSKFYSSLKHVPKTAGNKTSIKTKAISPPPPRNLPCARLNLFPLLETQDDETLYQLAGKILKAFYGIEFLDDWIETINKQQCTQLEKVSFKDPKLQSFYYKMLKGSKTNLPSLLDLISLDKHPSKICLMHAHSDLLAAIFGKKGGAKLYKMLHDPQGSAITKTTIEQICLESQIPYSESFVDLFSWNKHKKKENELIGIDEDSKVMICHRLPE